MTWTAVADVLGAVCLLLGCALALVAALGLARFPDLLSRMHAATKPQSLGLLLLVAGLALVLREPTVLWTLALVVAFQLITAPISAHMLGRAGYRTGKVRADLLVVDELTADLDRAEREQAQRERAQRDPGAR
ncbi:monovalent cation/H(+) antiporter subunit G [Georgenia faecalis]|uniref:Monovalent cation/H(+) antiporter subunit G n=1 Tax=Georgenia faecalis TaxID=2483799 RepID=A0ABV9D8N0_9MICO|nr:monovalent cation/H(+) antiporter subunit G [Georgenia faecalis]